MTEFVPSVESFDYLEPEPKFEKDDTCGLRAKILSLAPSQARQLGIWKSTLHYLRNRARYSRQLNLYSSVREKRQTV